ncbi:MAG: hypothetical protein AB1487_02485 [Thermodesulfobacteriota bacterium]
MKQSNVSPSISEWRELYEQADRFRDLKPWTWMSDADLFGVQNPEDMEIGYCCVLGELGEVLALVVYQGSEGLAGYLKMQSGEFDYEDPSAIHLQKCLMASFEDRKHLTKEDLQIVKALDLKYRGHQAWPQFRSYLPGYLPWVLTKGEVSFLKVALDQAIEVCIRFREDPGFLDPPEEGEVLVRTPVPRGSKIEWQNIWIRPPAAKPRVLPTISVDEIRVQRIRKNKVLGKGTWEIDFFYFPGSVREGERPFSPVVFAVVDKTTGLILHNWMNPPSELFADFQTNILDVLSRSRTLPRQVLVAKSEMGQMLQPIIAGLGIELKMTPHLRGVERVEKEMYAHFTS